jgi:hypothetical protein
LLELTQRGLDFGLVRLRGGPGPAPGCGGLRVVLLGLQALRWKDLDGLAPLAVAGGGVAGDDGLLGAGEFGLLGSVDDNRPGVGVPPAPPMALDRDTELDDVTTPTTDRLPASCAAGAL